jgi:hypothetical protein
MNTFSSYAFTYAVFGNGRRVSTEDELGSSSGVGVCTGNGEIFVIEGRVIVEDSFSL